MREVDKPNEVPKARVKDEPGASNPVLVASIAGVAGEGSRVGYHLTY
jgi:hypothetical protein